MAFLDNSGDIILDAVLTDTGRLRLARGDGSFKIVKFAFSDDEIDYNNYNKNSPSGSSYYDLEILQTPIFEAFSDNAASLNSRLITISRTDLLYLPVLKVNENADATAKNTSGTFLCAVDKTTENNFSSVAGTLFGNTPANANQRIRIDQGLDTTEIEPQRNLDADLIETQYEIQVDNRLGSIVSAIDDTIASVSFVDDDNIATYKLSLGANPQFVRENINREISNKEAISGPRGTILEFKVQSSIDLASSTFLFTRLGSTTTISGNAVKYIDSNIKILGITTGYRLDVPVRFIKS